MNIPKYPNSGDDVLQFSQEMWRYAKSLTPSGEGVTIGPDGTTIAPPRILPEYDGPFAPTIETGNEEVTFGQVYVYAGAGAEYSWPASGDKDYINISELAATTTGKYLVYITLTVDVEYGWFTASDKPLIEVVNEELYSSLQGAFSADMIIAELTVDMVTTKIKEVKPVRRSHIYVPVINIFDTSKDNFFYATWKMHYPNVAAPADLPDRSIPPPTEVN